MPNARQWMLLQAGLVDGGLLSREDVRDVHTEADVSPALAGALDEALGRYGGAARWREHVQDLAGWRDIFDTVGRGFCGTPDQGGTIRPQTFGSPGGRWTRGNLTFSVNPAGCNLPAAAVNAVIQQAFALWQAVTFFFNFSLVPAGGDMRVAFGGAGTDSRFGSSGGVAGSAAYPPLGNINFDAAEAWTNASLLTVALHEIGHALGLSHSNSPSSLMYPFAPSGAAVDPETAAALRALYGWAPQTPLADRATTDRPALAQAGDADFTSSSFSLFSAWKGTQGDQGLWWSGLAGSAWSPQERIAGVGSSLGPSMCSVRVPGDSFRTGLLMAWKGVSGDQGIYYAFNPGPAGWSGQRRVPGAGTNARPAVVEYNGTPWMAWKGVDGDSGLYWSRFVNGDWLPQQRVTGVGTSDAPALVVYNNFLYMFWKGVRGDSGIYFTRIGSAPAAIWDAQNRVSYTESDTRGQQRLMVGTTNGPSATLRGDRILLAWKGVEGDTSIWFSLFDGSEFSGQVSVANVGTSNGPCVCAFAGQTHMLWQGVPGDDGIYWSLL